MGIKTSKVNNIVYTRELDKNLQLCVKTINNKITEIIRIYDKNKKQWIEAKLVMCNIISPICLSYVFENRIALKIYKGEPTLYSLYYNDNTEILTPMMSYDYIHYFSENFDKIYDMVNN
jgi:hypothetical protein